MRDPTYPLVPIASTLAASLIVLSFVANGTRGTRNRGVVILGSWVLLGNLMTAVQAIVWGDTDEILAPVLCDISKPYFIDYPDHHWSITERCQLHI